MNTLFPINPLRWLACVLAVCLMLLGAGQGIAAETGTNSAAALRAKYTELGPQLSNNQFKRPLHLVSTETSNQLKGDIYALVDYPFAAVSETLTDPADWCDVLILHLNTKYCRASTNNTGTMLAVSIGKKNFQQLDDAYRVNFAYNVVIKNPEYFDVSLHSPKGPLGTSDYRIQLEAVSAPAGKTFLHLTYSYSHNFTARIAMQGYLATIGSGKVGFTQTGKQSNGQPEYIGGVRGVVERNTMRYYLAIDAYLGELSTPPAERLEKRLLTWFNSTERYAQQLHEVERADYLDMKRREYQRQQQ